ncbi:apolipoprotein L3-like [Brachyistius frenatus]|uniref:apolipoprotein L3-like n=1 Tax=Brachyistius frenatus TaxID=100188 RepID=UPI0037E7FFBE
MTQPKRPIPLPRTQLYPPVKTEDDKPLSQSSTPQSHIRSPQRELGPTTPPPVAPKTWKMSSRGSETANDYVNGTKDTNSLADWFKKMTPWRDLCRELTLRGASDEEIIKVKAEQLYEVIQFYIQQVFVYDGALRGHIDELRGIAGNLDKVSKGTKIAGITGGATTAAGGVAAVAGIILAPFTLGASLALTAVGVGVAAAGGVTGVSAAITHKVTVNQDKKKINKTLQDFEQLNMTIEAILKSINEGMEQLKQHGLSVLSKTRVGSVKAAKMVKLAASGEASAIALEENNKASGLINGFALGLDFYFVQKKDGQKIKKGLESKFAKKIRKLAEDLEKGVNELVKMSDLFSKHCSEV